MFVALAEGDEMRLDSVQVQIDGQPVAHYIYSFKELDALRKGGVQRVYTGNVPTGEHRIDVAVSGKLPGGADYSHAGSFAFQKGAEPKLVGVKLASPAPCALCALCGEPRTSAAPLRSLWVGTNRFSKDSYPRRLLQTAQMQGGLA